MSTSNGKAAGSHRPGNVKSLVVIACNEYDHSSRSLVSIATGSEAIHVARGPWSAQTREVVTIVSGAYNLDALMRALELACDEGAVFYMVAIRAAGEGHIEFWSNGHGKVYSVGVDCDDKPPGSLAACRDEARAIACANMLAEAFADMASALQRGLSVSSFVHSGGRS